MTRARRILLGTVSIFLGAVVAFGQSSGATDRAEALAEAARKGDAAVVKKLLDEGIDVNTKFRYRRIRFRQLRFLSNSSNSRGALILVAWPAICIIDRYGIRFCFNRSAVPINPSYPTIPTSIVAPSSVVDNSEAIPESRK